MSFHLTRYFAVALRAEEWDAAYKSMYNQLKPGGYFQVLEPSILVRKVVDGIQGNDNKKRETVCMSIKREGHINVMLTQ
jgi:hypothetical protein